MRAVVISMAIPLALLPLSYAVAGDNTSPSATSQRVAPLSDGTVSDINACRQVFKISPQGHERIAEKLQDQTDGETSSSSSPDNEKASESQNHPAQVDEVVSPSDTDEAEAKAKRDAEQAAWNHFDEAHQYIGAWDFELADTEFEESIISLPTIPVVHRDYCLLCAARLNLSKAVAEFMLATGLGVPVAYTPFEKAEVDARAAKLHYRKALSFGQMSQWK